VEKLQTLYVIYFNTWYRWIKALRNVKNRVLSAGKNIYLISRSISAIGSFYKSERRRAADEKCKNRCRKVPPLDNSIVDYWRKNAN